MRPRIIRVSVLAGTIAAIASFGVSADTQTVSPYPYAGATSPPSQMSDAEAIGIMLSHREAIQTVLIGEPVDPDAWTIELFLDVPGAREGFVAAVDEHNNAFEIQLLNTEWVDATEIEAHDAELGSVLSSISMRVGVSDAVISSSLGEIAAVVIAFEWLDADNERTASAAVPILISPVESIVHVTIDPKITREQLLQCLWEKEHAKRLCRQNYGVGLAACVGGAAVGCIFSGPGWVPCFTTSGIVCGTGALIGAIVHCELLTGDEQFYQCMYRSLGVGPLMSYEGWLFWQNAIQDALQEQGL